MLLGGRDVVIREGSKIGGMGGWGECGRCDGSGPRRRGEPGGEFALVAVGVPVFEDALEDDLDDVFGGINGAGEPGEETEERTVVPLEKIAEAGELAGAYLEHQVVVAGIVHGFREHNCSVLGRGSEGDLGRREGHGATAWWAGRGRNRTEAKALPDF